MMGKRVQRVVRRAPTQERSITTFERALVAAGAVLQKNGFDGFSIPAVAGEVGVAPGTLYQYFPNKYTMLRLLVEQWYTKSYLSDEDKIDVDLLAKIYRDEPNCVALLEAIQSVPELREYDHRIMEDSVKRWAKQISAGREPSARQMAQARVIIYAIDGVLRNAARQSEADADETIAILKLWIEPLLETLPPVRMKPIGSL